MDTWRYGTWDSGTKQRVQIPLELTCKVNVALFHIRWKLVELSLVGASPILYTHGVRFSAAAWEFTTKTEATCASQILRPLYQTTLRHVPEDINFSSHCRKNLVYIVNIFLVVTMYLNKTDRYCRLQYRTELLLAHTHTHKNTHTPAHTHTHIKTHTLGKTFVFCLSISSMLFL
jgi:hypothetical protein